MNPVSLTPTQPIQVFFCYSRNDEELRDELANHLTMLKRQQVISAWYDRDITAGSDWVGEINAYLNTAQIILLLISADFLASDYCYDVELARAMQRHAAGEARVIPVILRPCDWQTAAFGTLRALPKNGLPITKWGDRDEAFLNVVQGIRAAILHLQNPEQVATRPTTFSTAVMGLMSTSAFIPALEPPVPSSVEVKRRFEAAMPGLAKVARTTEVRAMVALSASLGLRAHLPDFTEAGDLISKKDTVNNDFPFEFPVDPATAEPIPTSVYLAVNAPGFEIAEPIKALHLAPRLDSGIVTFFLTPTQRQERARVAVELFKDASRTTLLSSLSLVTEVKGQQDELAQTVWHLVSLPFNLIGRFQPQDFRTMSESYLSQEKASMVCDLQKKMTRTIQRIKLVVGAVIFGVFLTVIGVRFWPAIEQNGVPPNQATNDPLPNAFGGDFMLPVNFERVNLQTADIALVEAIAIHYFRNQDLPKAEQAFNALLDRGALQAADRAFKSVLKEDLSKPSINFLRGKLAWQAVKQGNPDYYSVSDAQRFWEAAVKKQPDSVSYHNALGFAYYEQGKSRQALNEWCTSIALLTGIPLTANTNIDFPALGCTTITQPIASSDELTAYAGIALALQQAVTNPNYAAQREDLLLRATQLYQVVVQSNPASVEPDELGKSWLWNERAIRDWQTLGTL